MFSIAFSVTSMSLTASWQIYQNVNGAFQPHQAILLDSLSLMYNQNELSQDLLVPSLKVFHAACRITRDIVLPAPCTPLRMTLFLNQERSLNASFRRLGSTGSPSDACLAYADLSPTEAASESARRCSRSCYKESE